MSWKVTSDEMARLYGGGASIFNPSRHDLVECDYIRLARRSCHKPNLFMYRHRRSGRYGVGCWVVKPGTGRGPGCFIEIENMEEHPDKYGGASWSDRPSISYLRARCQPVDEMLKAEARKQALAEYDEDVSKEETDRERQELAKFFRGKGARFEKLAQALASGESEFVGEREGGQQLKDVREMLTSL